MQRMWTKYNIKANRVGGEGVHNFNCSTYICRIVKSCSKFIFIISVLIITINQFVFMVDADEITVQYSEFYDLLNIDRLEDVTEDNINEYYDLDLSDPKSLWQINGYDVILNIVKKNLSIDGSALNILSVLLVFIIVFMVTKVTLTDNSGLTVTFDTVSAVVCSLIFLLPVSLLIDDVCSTVKSCCVFMNAFIPIYSSLIVAVGYSATSASYSTLMFSVTQIFTVIADKFIVPLSNVTLVSSVGAAFNSVSKKYNELLRKTIVITLSSSMGIFIAVLNLQTVISAPSDTIGIKTVKTALGTFIPIVGTALSDSVSVLLAGASTLKSTVGVYAVINIVICVVPVLVKLLVWRLTVAISGTLLDLSGSENSVIIVRCIGNVITLMISVLLCVTVAYLLSVILTLSIGG